MWVAYTPPTYIDHEDELFSCNGRHNFSTAQLLQLLCCEWEETFSTSFDLPHSFKVFENKFWTVSECFNHRLQLVPGTRRRGGRVLWRRLFWRGWARGRLIDGHTRCNASLRHKLTVWWPSTCCCVSRTADQKQGATRTESKHVGRVALAQYQNEETAECGVWSGSGSGTQVHAT